MLSLPCKPGSDFVGRGAGKWEFIGGRFDGSFFVVGDTNVIVMPDHSGPISTGPDRPSLRTVEYCRQCRAQKDVFVHHA